MTADVSEQMKIAASPGGSNWAVAMKSCDHVEAFDFIMKSK